MEPRHHCVRTFPAAPYPSLLIRIKDAPLKGCGFACPRRPQPIEKLCINRCGAASMAFTAALACKVDLGGRRDAGVWTTEGDGGCQVTRFCPVVRRAGCRQSLQSCAVPSPYLSRLGTPPPRRLTGH